MPNYMIKCPNCGAEDGFHKVTIGMELWVPVASRTDFFEDGEPFLKETYSEEIWEGEDNPLEINLYCETCEKRFPALTFPNEQELIEYLIEQGYAKEVD